MHPHRHCRRDVHATSSRHEEHDREADWRWGNTDAFRESQKRMARYAPADIERMKAEQRRMLEAVAALQG